MTTIVASHAHPDDEVLLTGGTLARLATEDHRVVIAVACSAGMGRPASRDPGIRLRELAASVAALGAARVVHLGYRLLVRYDPAELRRSFTPRSAITHRVNVRRYAAGKRVALAACQSYVHSGGRAARLARVMLALPVPVFALFFGREWFAEPGSSAATVGGDILRAAPLR